MRENDTMDVPLLLYFAFWFVLSTCHPSCIVKPPVHDDLRVHAGMWATASTMWRIRWH